MKHFTLKELTTSETADRLKIDNTPTASAVENLHRLIDTALDPLREAYGRPIYVNSGYRCPALNRAVGGVPHSYHLTGRAADITGGNKHENRIIYETALKMNLPLAELINEHGYTWLHIAIK